MDYLKRIENSVTNFEAETAKLAKINKLIQHTDTLINAVSKEEIILKNAGSQLENFKIQIAKDCETLAEYTKTEETARQKLIADIHQKFMADSQTVIEKLSTPLEQIAKDCETLAEYTKTEEAARQKLIADIHQKFMADSRAVIEKLSTPLEQITKDCETLAEYTRTEEAARQKLIADIHQKFMADSRTVIEELSTPLENSRTQIAESCRLIQELIETHQKSQEKFLANLETILIKYNTKNIEVYHNITGTLTNKIDVCRDNIETNLNLKMNGCIQEISNLNNQIEKNTIAIHREISGVSDELKTALNEIFSTAKYIKSAVSIAVGTGIIACAGIAAVAITLMK